LRPHRPVKVHLTFSTPTQLLVHVQVTPWDVVTLTWLHLILGLGGRVGAGLCVGVRLAVGIGVSVGLGVAVRVGVGVGAAVGVGVGAAVGVGVAFGPAE
jgi:hypothetical protein